MLLVGCGKKEKRTDVIVKAETVHRLPELKIFNMGGIPEKIMLEFTERMKLVYANTVYAGSMELTDSALLKNDRKGKDRYSSRILMDKVRKTIDKKHEIALVVVNGDVCNWTKNGSHANLGISLMGQHISLVSYRRLEVNGLATTDNMLKVAVHELGHSVCSLVRERKDLRFHCPDKKCLMLDAKNRFPYRNISGFCTSCDSIMKVHGFETEHLNFR